MLSSIMPWVEMALRWAHVIAGISWIGTSFYFVWLDNNLRPPREPKEGVAGELWAVHGGGFYHKQKYAVAPETLPEHLHWFKWEAYFTWISGFMLLAVVYYIGADIFLIDRSKVDMTAPVAIAASLAILMTGWLVYDGLCRVFADADKQALLGHIWFSNLVVAAYGLTHLFSDRAAFLHVGAIVGTVMAANVFFVIIPNQRKATAAMLAGEAPDPNLGKAAKQRSLHNNYMTLPVVLIMVSGHYPMLFGASLNWLLLAGLALVGVLVRHYFNLKNVGVEKKSLLAWAGAAFAGVAAMAIASQPPAPSAELASFTGVRAIMERHCVTCHAAQPTHEGFSAPPLGVVLTDSESIKRYAPQILQQTVLTEVMPLGNETGMTADERAELNAWISAGAPIEAPP